MFFNIEIQITELLKLKLNWNSVIILTMIKRKKYKMFIIMKLFKIKIVIIKKIIYNKIIYNKNNYL